MLGTMKHDAEFPERRPDGVIEIGVIHRAENELKTRRFGLMALERAGVPPIEYVVPH
ncbi:MAG: hypothetical protein JWL85_573 [Candidatus Saccharibacteria bacterium]|nr:hypothetical protein [Candidatus Saccharibacteria bacterium]